MAENGLQSRSYVHAASILLLAALFIVAGINHFLNPAFYVNIMPPYLPWASLLVFVSGVFEIIGGVGVAVPILRRAAGWGLIALLVAVFPANIHMAIYPEDFVEVPTWLLWLRLPLQFVLIVWVWWTTIHKAGA